MIRRARISCLITLLFISFSTWCSNKEQEQKIYPQLTHLYTIAALRAQGPRVLQKYLKTISKKSHKKDRHSKQQRIPQTINTPPSGLIFDALVDLWSKNAESLFAQQEVKAHLRPLSLSTNFPAFFLQEREPFNLSALFQRARPPISGFIVKPSEHWYALTTQKTVACIDMGLNQCLTKQQLPTHIKLMATSFEGTALAIATDEHKIFFYRNILDKKQSPLIPTFDHDTKLTALALSKSGLFMAFAEGCLVHIWETSTQKLNFDLWHPATVTHLAFSPLTHNLAAVFGSTIRIWDGETKEYQQYTLSSPIKTIAWASHQNKLFIGCKNGDGLLWDVEKNQFKSRKQNHEKHALIDSVFSSDGALLALRSSKNKTTIFDANTGALICTNTTQKPIKCTSLYSDRKDTHFIGSLEVTPDSQVKQNAVVKKLPFFAAFLARILYEKQKPLIIKDCWIQQLLQKHSSALLRHFIWKKVGSKTIISLPFMEMMEA